MSDLLSELVLIADKVIIGYFNIHIDVDSCRHAFDMPQGPAGISKHVNEPTHSFNHSQDLVLTYGLEIT